MRFSNDAMRDVLIFIKENIVHKYENDGRDDTSFTQYMIVENEYFSDLFSKHKYSKDELSYTIEKMIEGGILNYTGNLNAYYQITDMSFRGVQLLGEIESEFIWEKVKNISDEIGNYSLYFIDTTAKKISEKESDKRIAVAAT